MNDKLKNRVVIHDNISRIIQKGSGVLEGIVVTPDGAGAEIKIYAGVNDSADEIIHLVCPADTSRVYSFRDGIYCETGIYITVNASTTIYTIMYDVL